MHFTAFMMLIFINWKYHTCQSRKNVLLILAMRWPMTQVRWSDYGAFGGVLCCKCGPSLAIHTPLLAFSKGIPKSQAFSDRILKWTIWCVDLILHSKNGIRKFWHSQIEPRTGWHFQMKYSLFVFLAFSDGILSSAGILKWNPTLQSMY